MTYVVFEITFFSVKKSGVEVEKLRASIFSVQMNVFEQGKR